MNKILYLGIIWLLSGCLSLPDLSQRTTSQYIPTQHAPRLEKTLQLPPNNTLNLDDLDLEHTPNQTKLHHTHHTNAYVHILDNAQDAFVARSTLIDNADISLDIQYYIWKNDITGSLLLHKLWQAAERGVRVRLLLDDNNTRGMDDILSYLNQHDNIEIRLFNPFLHRHWRALGYLTDFPRMNRRMHNKSLTADGLVSVVGGRNIGDEYFNATSGIAFADLDVAVVGNGAKQTTQEFDTYWNHEVSYPAELIIGDNPDKALNKNQHDNLMQKYIAPLMEKTQEKVIIVSPYFVPTKQGEKFLSGLANNGKQVHILTNSLMANDVAVVHSGYAKYRQDLLKNGVQLYELKADATITPAKIASVYDGQGASLQAKTFAIDGRYLYVGSFNFDPPLCQFKYRNGLYY